jgi:hypothetical protein
MRNLALDSTRDSDRTGLSEAANPVARLSEMTQLYPRPHADSLFRQLASH